MTAVFHKAIPNQPRFHLRWLLDRSTPTEEWLDNPEWVPQGQKAVYRTVKEGFKQVLQRLDREGVILLPAYVPGGLVETVLAAGFDVRYYPVEPDLSLDPEAVTDRLEALSPAAIVFIHYVGFADEHYPMLRDVAAESGTLVIEDCARGLFSHDSDGTLLGTTGDIALFSLYKTLPAPNGGLITSRVGPVPEPTVDHAEWQELVETTAEALLNRFGIKGQQRTETVVDDMPTYREAVQPNEECHTPGWVSKRAFSHVDPAAVQSARNERYCALRERLVDAGVPVVTPPAPTAAAPYGVGVLLSSERERTQLLSTLHEKHLPHEVLTWPPVHRIAKLKSFEGGMALRRRLVVFPTHQQVPHAVLSRLAEIVTTTIDEKSRALTQSEIGGFQRVHDQ
jgi:dTDP-4-amino-4,6-dideoxygalactose transaminase